MCTTCGCGGGAKGSIHNLQTGNHSLMSDDWHDPLEHVHADGTRHSHSHDHDHVHDERAHSHDHRNTNAHTKVDLQTRILAKNDELAAKNRAWFAGQEILAVNLVSSPGSGKTLLLERTIRGLTPDLPLYVIEGDQATVNDAERIRDAGAAVVQVNTGTGCHLEADMIARGLTELRPCPGSVLIIENVGNLVCPALFDLGERLKAVIFSITEGEDKPLKYPHMFGAASVVILNKMDLLPHLDFDISRAIANARAVNPKVEILQLSCKTGEGLADWLGWLRRQKGGICEAASAEESTAKFI